MSAWLLCHRFFNTQHVAVLVKTTQSPFFSLVRPTQLAPINLRHVEARLSHFDRGIVW